MILSAVFSKPSKTCQEIFGKPYIKIRIWKNPSPSAKTQNKFQAEFFTEKQAFQKSFTAEQAWEFIEKHAGTAFKNCIVKTDTEEITTMANKKGEIKVFRKATKNFSAEQKFSNNFNRIKNYILQEGNPVPFLIELGVMTKDGKVVAQKYDKFRQINRFLEFINDIIESIEKLNGASYTQENPLRIVDFGSGKSYLTFAVYYFLTELKKIPAYITGLDLKEDVIKNCDSLAKKLGCKNLEFKIGNIADYSSEKNPDIIITLHACDTATDFALDYAVKHNAKAILSVPCCQLEKQKIKSESPFASIERFGILRERFAAIATDAIRAELLEQCGYTVQVLEFIDMSHTPKNILIRAVKKQSDNFKNKESKIRIKSLLDELYCNQTLEKLLSKESKL